MRPPLSRSFVYPRVRLADVALSPYLPALSLTLLPLSSPSPPPPLSSSTSRTRTRPATVRSDLFQHRLWLPQPPQDDAPHPWTDVLIPLSDFTLTNSGDLSATQLDMLRTEVRTVGISVLGPLEGRYELGVERIDAVRLEGDEARRAREGRLEGLPEQRDAEGDKL